MNDQETEAFLLSAFEENFERLRQETGRAPNPNVKAAALEQVKLYWRKLRDVAERVTETEVRLTLPEQRSPGGQRFTLSGVVDIVREDDEVVMYDIKSHVDAETVRDGLEAFEKQLNVYAHIWQNLRGQPLDSAAIIATAPTPALKHALNTGDPGQVERALAHWDPLVEVSIDPEGVQAVIREFGLVVDNIERRRFSPAPVEKLLAPAAAGSRNAYGTTVCRNCDARFSCESYRQYAQRGEGATRPGASLESLLEEYRNDEEQQAWLEAELQISPVRE